MKRSRGFTLIELLVVVAIIGVLIAILVPSLGRVRDTSRRTVCGTNLKSQGSAMSIYAQQFLDYLPAFTNGSGYWVHDEPFEFSETLLNTSRQAATDMSPTSIRRWFYCPSNSTSTTADELWNYGPRNGQNYRAMGYTYLNDRRAAGGNGNYPALPVRVFPRLAYRSKLVSTPFPADNELALDEIMSPDNNGLFSQFNVPPPTNAAPAGTSHMKGKVPSGANLLFFDGHVAWRPWPRDAAKVLAIANAGNSNHWLINP